MDFKIFGSKVSLTKIEGFSLILGFIFIITIPFSSASMYDVYKKDKKTGNKSANCEISKVGETSKGELNISFSCRSLHGIANLNNQKIYGTTAINSIQGINSIKYLEGQKVGIFKGQKFLNNEVSFGQKIDGKYKDIGLELIKLGSLRSDGKNPEYFYEDFKTNIREYRKKGLTAFPQKETKKDAIEDIENNLKRLQNN